MKKVRLDKEEGSIKELDTDNDLYCPITPTPRCGEAVECGSWCAWFDIDDREVIRPPKDKYSKFVTIKVIVCKDTPIAELIEEEE